MALAKCKECGNEVSTEAASCPKCGARGAPPWYFSSAFLALTFLIFWPLGLLLIWLSPSRAFTKILATVFALLVSVFLFVSCGEAMRNAGRAAEQSSNSQTSVLHAATRIPSLEFGKPTVKTSMGTTDVAVEATNVSGVPVKSCIITATFKKGDTILGTANGAVNEVPAGETRTAQLIGADAVTGYDTLKVEASTCF